MVLRYSVAYHNWVMHCLYNYNINIITTLTRMWANVQRDGRPTEYRLRPLFNAVKFG